MKQFSDVNCTYGAPMGRAEYGRAPSGEEAERTVALFRVRFVDGDYDDGGAYWGGGMPLYCARSQDGDYRAFIRARNRLEAAVLLGLDFAVLQNPIRKAAL